MPATKTSKSNISKSGAARSPKAAPAKKAATPETVRLREVSPSFTVNDLQKSLAWYQDVLGFSVDERWERDGKLLGVSLRAGATTFMIGQDDWKKGRDRKKGEGFRLYCTTTQNVDGEKVGFVNKAFAFIYPIRLVGKRMKAWNYNVYYAVKYALVAAVLAAILVPVLIR